MRILYVTTFPLYDGYVRRRNDSASRPLSLHHAHLLRRHPQSLVLLLRILHPPTAQRTASPLKSGLKCIRVTSRRDTLVQPNVLPNALPRTHDHVLRATPLNLCLRLLQPPRQIRFRQPCSLPTSFCPRLRLPKTAAKTWSQLLRSDALRKNCVVSVALPNAAACATAAPTPCTLQPKLNLPHPLPTPWPRSTRSQAPVTLQPFQN